MSVCHEQRADDVVVQPAQVGGDVAAGFHVQAHLQALVDDLDCLGDSCPALGDATFLHVQARLSDCRARTLVKQGDQPLRRGAHHLGLQADIGVGAGRV